VAPKIDLAQTSLLIVAHGTDLNEKQRRRAKREADKFALGRICDGAQRLLEEPPLVSDWEKN